ncbi:MAG: oxidoreductase [Sumerlaeia bacterium]
MAPQKWIITGCSSGFGRAIALKALQQGHKVALTARDLNTIQEIAEEFPDQAACYELDVTDSGRIRFVVAEANKRFGGIDVLVNNAGYGLLAALEETTEVQMRKVFETIVYGSVEMTRAVLPIFREQKSGRVINMSAKAGYDNYPGFAAYGGAKYALEGISEALAKEVAPFNVKVTLVEPGPFRTQFIGKSMQHGALPNEAYKATVGKFGTILKSIDGKQKGDPEKAAELILKIAQDENPPLRLPLGAYALNAWRQKMKLMEAEFSKWEADSKATDF